MAKGTPLQSVLPSSPGTSDPKLFAPVSTADSHEVHQGGSTVCAKWQKDDRC